MTSSTTSLMSFIGLGCLSFVVGCGNGSDTGGGQQNAQGFGGQ